MDQMLQRNISDKNKTDLSLHSERMNCFSNRLFLKSRFDTASCSSTPKNIRFGNIQQKRGYLSSNRNEQPFHFVYQDSDKYKKYKKDKNKMTFQYESISKKNKSMTVQKVLQDTSSNLDSQSYPDTFELYNSIQNNLSECDKIIKKLKNSHVNIKLQHPLQTKPQKSINQFKNTDKSQQKYTQNQHNTQKLRNSKTVIQNITNTDLYQSIYPNSFKFQTKKQSTRSSDDIFLASNIRPNLNLREQEQKNPLIELRRNRIHEIIKGRKDYQGNALQQSLFRIKARGQKVFSKMIRSRQTSTNVKNNPEQRFITLS